MGGDVLSPAPEPFDQTLVPHPASVGAARGLVRELVTVGGRHDLLDDAVLLVSEIVTNALIHAGSPIRVRGRLGERGIRVEVSDASPHHPALRDYAETAGTGRGLAMLVALVDDWGVAPGEGGKTVWFELGGVVGSARETHTGATATSHSSVDDPSATPAVLPGLKPATGSSVVLHVELLMMPLLLHEAWREQAETLLREYLLSSLDFSSDLTNAVDGTVTTGSHVMGEDPIQVHADATDAMALLEEQVPVADIDMEPARLMAEATGPGVTATRVWVAIPEASVPHFATLEWALDQAFALVTSGRLLAPPAQPEVQAFRRWVCRQVAQQSLGSSPEPWSIDRETGPLPAGQIVRAGFEDITTSTETLVVADDANQIVAVSATAADLLGYDSPAELVGRRLTAIIPNRFHQAHIAGFTLHLLVGRSPLLGQQVDVPALRRDGSEVTVRLELSTRTGPDGDRAFVARMQPVIG